MDGRNMSGECDDCGEHCLECRCGKGNMWKTEEIKPPKTEVQIGILIGRAQERLRQILQDIRMEEDCTHKTMNSKGTCVMDNLWEVHNLLGDI